MGALFGGLLVFALSIEQHQELSRYTGSFLQVAIAGQLHEWQLAFWPAYWSQVKWLGLTWLLGISVIGLPLVAALNFLKGVLVGFAVTYLGTQLSWKGVLLSVLAILPGNLMIVPCLLIASAASISYSLYLIRKRMSGSSPPSARPFRTFTAVSALMAVLMLPAVALERFVVPHGLEWLAPFFV
jgi:stage II sporulation protein M